MTVITVVCNVMLCTSMNGLPATKLNIVTAYKTIFMILPATITSNLTTILISLFFLYIQLLVFDYKTLPRIRIELAEGMVHWLNFPVTVVNCYIPSNRRFLEYMNNSPLLMAIISVRLWLLL